MDNFFVCIAISIISVCLIAVIARKAFGIKQWKDKSDAEKICDAIMWNNIRF